MSFPLGALVTQAAAARNAYTTGQRSEEDSTLRNALLLRQLQGQDAQQALAQRIGNAQIGHLQSQTEGQWGQPFQGEDAQGPGLFHTHKITGATERVKTGSETPSAPTATGPSGPMPGDSQDMTGEQAPLTLAQKLAQQGGGVVRPVIKPMKPDPVAVHAANRKFDQEHPLPSQPTNVYLTSVDPTTGKSVVTVGNSKGDPNLRQTNIEKPTAGGSRTGSQTSVADMEQRLSEIKQHATALAQGKGTINRAMQAREGMEYGIANQSAGGHGVPLMQSAAAAGMDALGIGGGPGDKTYDDYAALMNSTRALGDDVAKVFKGRQNEDAVKREIALAQLSPGDFQNKQVVAQKLARLENIIGLAKATMPATKPAGGHGTGGYSPNNPFAKQP